MANSGIALILLLRVMTKRRSSKSCTRSKFSTLKSTIAARDKREKNAPVQKLRSTKSSSNCLGGVQIMTNKPMMLNPKCKQQSKTIKSNLRKPWSKHIFLRCMRERKTSSKIKEKRWTWNSLSKKLTWLSSMRSLYSSNWISRRCNRISPFKSATNWFACWFAQIMLLRAILIKLPRFW